MSCWRGREEDKVKVEVEGEVEELRVKELRRLSNSLTIVEHGLAIVY
jgi:hypothetical protein